jgi:iron complex outermembrane receptor protein
MLPLARALTGASILPLLYATPALAEDQPREAIVVTGRYEIAGTPGGTDMIDAAEFEDRLAVSLRDALAFSPGVYAQPRFGQEVRLSLRGSGIGRGFHMRGLTLLQDGVPVNFADNNGDFQELDPQVFHQIEVYRGANALRFGSATLGGGINAVTPTGRTSPGIEMRIDGGSFDTARGKIAVGFADARGDAFVALTGDRSDGDRRHARRDAIRFNGNAGILLLPGVETRFYASVNHIDQDLPGALTRREALASPATSRPSNIVMDQERDIDSLRLQNRTTIDAGFGTISVGGYYSAKQLFHPIFEVIDQKWSDRGLFARADLEGEIAGLPVEASFGTTARFGVIHARQFVNSGGRRGRQTQEMRQTARSIDSFGEVRLRPFAGLTLIAGGIHSSGRRAIDNRLVPARGGHASFDAFAPRFGLMYQPVEAIQFYGNYSRSVELPGLSELGQVQVDPGFVPLDPQRAWTAELGTRGRSGIAAWDIGIYRADIRGEMLQFSLAARPDIPAAPFNAGRTRHQGIEASLDLDLAPWARLRQVYQYNDFRFRRDRTYGANRLPVIPTQQYRAALRIGGDRLSLTPGVEWVPRGAWADYDNTTRAPGYVLVGLGAEAALRPGVTLFIDARNLTNERAIGDISAVVAANGESAIYYPVERRAAYGGIRARF